ncbi:PAS domain-containing protein, partial [Ectothiorhodospira haloalkaliphila]|uniref:PAS domain-containing protein n=1 Tax=Ectothiorhodospira haloalkaliphila TaxID=421628 RepID=UPI001EE8C5F8
VGSWVSDFRENVIRWSPEVYRIFGLSPNAWRATHEAFMSLVHPEDRERVQLAVDAALAGDAYDIEHRILRPDGTIRIVRERGKVEFDDAGRPLQMIGTVHDITDRKWQEEELRRRELRYRHAQQAARFGIWEWELAEDRIHWDANCWTMLGYAPDTPGV